MLSTACVITCRRWFVGWVQADGEGEQQRQTKNAVDDQSQGELLRADRAKRNERQPSVDEAGVEEEQNAAAAAAAAVAAAFAAAFAAIRQGAAAAAAAEASIAQPSASASGAAAASSEKQVIALLLQRCSLAAAPR